MWLNLLQRMSFIDGIEQNCDKEARLTLNVVPVGQFREIGRNKYNETLKISWFRGSTLQPEWNDLVDVTLPITEKGQTWTVRTEFVSSQIRKKSDLLKSSLSFRVCG
jgi:hypothetical protein